MPEMQGERVRFSEYELDLRSGELWDAARRRVPLPTQPLRILAALIRARGDIVTREQLQRELWRDDTFVDYEHGLNAAIKRLREAISDSASAPRFIETIPRVGYRFLCPTSSTEKADRLESARADKAIESRTVTAPVSGREGVAAAGAVRYRAVGVVAGIAVLLIRQRRSQWASLVPCTTSINRDCARSQRPWSTTTCFVITCT
jgi:DNA-binding winged helix-turn-helix (wHTH) protein